MSEMQLPPERSPRPFGEIPPLWTKVLQMTEGFFAQEAPRASASNTLLSILILAVVSMILSGISTLTWRGTQAAFLPPEYREAFGTAAGAGAGPILCALCGGIFGTFVGFYLASGLVYLGARVFGGTGDFGTQTYLQSLLAVPTGIVSGVLSVIPCVGPLLALAVAVFAIILNVRAVKVTHNLTTGKAVAAVLVPAILVAVLVGCLIAIVMATLAPVMFNTFQNVMPSVQ
jgi:hypothetical protein